jgi:carbamoyltransferase
MLTEDAKEVLEDFDGQANRFMTMAHMTRQDKRSALKGVINVDGSCRPQIIKDDTSLYGKLLQEVKTLTGHGIVLNTSFNVHGDPLVCSPSDAIETMKTTGTAYMAIENYLVRQPD